jgi:hypothetical protein
MTRLFWKLLPVYGFFCDSGVETLREYGENPSIEYNWPNNEHIDTQSVSQNEAAPHTHKPRTTAARG